MMRRVIGLIVVIGATAALYGAFWWVSERQMGALEIVVAKPDLRPEYQHHGHLVLNPAGVAFSLLLLAVHAAITATVVLFAVGRAGGVRRLAIVSACVVTGSALFVAVVHPHLLSVLLPAGPWQRYSSLAQRLVPPLERVYQYSQTRALVWQMVLTHAVLAYLLGSVAGWWTKGCTPRP
jgi:hypothetical protein